MSKSQSHCLLNFAFLVSLAHGREKLYIAAMQSFSGVNEMEGPMMKTAMDYMLLGIQRSSNLLPDYDVVLDYVDDSASADVAAANFVNLTSMPDRRHVAMLGPSDYTVAPIIGRLTMAAGMPHVSLSNQLALSDRAVYPYHFRSVQARDFLLTVVSWFVRANGWRDMLGFWKTKEERDLALPFFDARNISVTVVLAGIDEPAWGDPWQDDTVRIVHSQRIRIRYENIGPENSRLVTCRLVRSGVSGMISIIEGGYQSNFERDLNNSIARFHCTLDEITDAYWGYFWIDGNIIAPGTCVYVDGYGQCVPPTLTGESYGNSSLACSSLETPNLWYNSEEMRQSMDTNGIPLGKHLDYYIIAGPSADALCAIILALHESIYSRNVSLSQLQSRNKATYGAFNDILSSNKFIGLTGAVEFNPRYGTTNPNYYFVVQHGLPLENMGVDFRDDANIVAILYPQDPSFQDIFFFLTNRFGIQFNDPRPLSTISEANAVVGYFPDCALLNAVLKGSNCSLCRPGSHYDVELGRCRNCSAGFFQPLRGKSNCLVCKEGTVSASIGASACDLCPAGSFCKAGSSEAVPCSPGTISEEASGKCDRCPLGTFQTQAGQSFCTSCETVIPGTSTNWFGSYDSEDCGCPEGRYRIVENGVAVGCNSCIEGMRCPGHASPLIEKGYFMWPSSSRTARSLDVYKCMSSLACVGQVNSSLDSACAPNFVGLNCGRCEEGYYPDSEGLCQVCVASKWMLPLSVFLAFLALGCGQYIWNIRQAKLDDADSALAAVTAGCTLYFLQTLSVYKYIKFNWPNMFSDTVQVFDLVLFDLRMLRASCWGSETLAFSYLTRLALPLVVTIMLAFWYLLSRILFRVSCGAFPAFDINDSINTALMLFQALYIALCTTVMSLIECYTSPNGKQTIRGYPYVECGSSEHHALMPFLALGIGYMIGLMVLFTWIACIAPARFGNIGFRRRTRFLTFKFRPDTWWYGIFLSLRSLCLAMVLVATPDEAYTQFFLILFIMMGALVLHIIVQPYLDHFATILESVQLGFLIVIIVLGSWFIEERDLGDPDVRDKGNMLAGAMVICVGLCVACVAVVLLYVAWTILWPDIYATRRAKENDRLADHVFRSCVVLVGSECDSVLKGVVGSATYMDRWHLQKMSDLMLTIGCNSQPKGLFHRRLNKNAIRTNRDSEITAMTEVSLERIKSGGHGHVSPSRSISKYSTLTKSNSPRSHKKSDGTYGEISTSDVFQSKLCHSTVSSCEIEHPDPHELARRYVSPGANSDIEQPQRSLSPGSEEERKNIIWF